MSHKMLLRASLRRLLTIVLPICGMATAAPANAAVMISQVYGGGGNSGAPLTNDFVELHNSGPALSACLDTPHGKVCLQSVHSRP